MNCTATAANSDYYLQYAYCEDPALVVVNALFLLLIVLCLCFGCSQNKYSRIGP